MAGKLSSWTTMSMSMSMSVTCWSSNWFSSPGFKSTYSMIGTPALSLLNGQRIEVFLLRHWTPQEIEAETGVMIGHYTLPPKWRLDPALSRFCLPHMPTDWTFHHTFGVAMALISLTTNFLAAKVPGRNVW